MWSLYYKLLLFIAHTTLALTYRTPIDGQSPGWGNAGIFVGNTITTLSHQEDGTIACMLCRSQLRNALDLTRVIVDIIAQTEGYNKIIAHCNYKSDDAGDRYWHVCTMFEDSPIRDLKLVLFSAEKPWALKDSHRDHPITVAVKLISSLGIS